jgi:poly-gamma-glutamate synthesis protein (capsule biosynthesis protein)
VKESAAEHGWAWVLGDAAPLLREADLAFANLETPVAPDHRKGIHGEVFDAPPEMLAGLREAGVDVLSMANNHVYDQGGDGLVETWTRVRDAGMAPIGAGPDCATARAPYVADVRGLRIAFLAFADLVNVDGNTTDDAACLSVSGPPCAAGECGRDAVHLSLDVDRLTAEVRAARAHADLVVVSFHWGVEYRTTPLPEYPKLAQALVDAGADVILGHHPHVLQPIASLTAADGRQAVVAYSLGNLVSNMAETWTPDQPAYRARTRDGVVLRLRVVRYANGLVSVGVEAVPLWTDNQPTGIRVRSLAAMRADPDPKVQGLATARGAEIGAILP